MDNWYYELILKKRVSEEIPVMALLLRERFVLIKKAPMKNVIANAAVNYTCMPQHYSKSI